MKCYFRVSLYSEPLFLVINVAQVKRISLSKNILRALDANQDIPPLTAYPRSHQVRCISVTASRVAKGRLLIEGYLPILSRNA